MTFTEYALLILVSGLAAIVAVLAWRLHLLEKHVYSPVKFGRRKTDVVNWPPPLPPEHRL